MVTGMRLINLGLLLDSPNKTLQKASGKGDSLANTMSLGVVGLKKSGRIFLMIRACSLSEIQKFGNSWNTWKNFLVEKEKVWSSEGFEPGSFETALPSEPPPLPLPGPYQGWLVFWWPTWTSCLRKSALCRSGSVENPSANETRPCGKLCCEKKSSYQKGKILASFLNGWSFFLIGSFQCTYKKQS